MNNTWTINPSDEWRDLNREWLLVGQRRTQTQRQPCAQPTSGLLAKAH